MFCYRESVGIYEMTVSHAQLFGLFVHSFYEYFLTACYIFGQSDTSVVGAGHGHSFQEFLHRVGFPDFHVHLASSHGGRSLRYGDLIIQAYLPCVYRIHHQQHGHHLGYRCKRQFFVSILLEQNLPCISVDQYSPFRRYFKRRFIFFGRCFVTYCLQFYRVLFGQVSSYSHKGAQYHCTS